MPRYDGFRPSDNPAFQVAFWIGGGLRTWGEVCKAAGLKPGKTPVTAKVPRMIAPAMLLGTKRGSGGGSGHGSGSCCGEAGCHG